MPPRAGQEQPRAPAVGRGLEGDGELGQLSLAPDEPLAAEPAGMRAIVPHGVEPVTVDRRHRDRRHAQAAGSAALAELRRPGAPPPGYPPPGDRAHGLPPPPSPALVADRTFVALWSAGTISIFGSLITRTALPFAAILVLDAGPLEISALRGVEQSRRSSSGCSPGAWVDRLRRRPIMIWADIGRAVLLASIPVAVRSPTSWACPARRRGVPRRGPVDLLRRRRSRPTCRPSCRATASSTPTARSPRAAPWPSSRASGSAAS